MKDKEKQIEEMAKRIHIATDLYYMDCIKVATYLFEKDNCRIIDKDSVVLSKEEYERLLRIESIREVIDKRKTFRFYKDENLSKELYLIPYSVCIRPSDDNMSLLSLYKTLVWCGYASENYWDWCENAKKAKEVSFYEYIDELIKAIQEQASKETAEKIIDLIKTFCPDKKFVEVITRIISERLGIEIKE